MVDGWSVNEENSISTLYFANQFFQNRSGVEIKGER